MAEELECPSLNSVPGEQVPVYTCRVMVFKLSAGKRI